MTITEEPGYTYGGIVSATQWNRLPLERTFGLPDPGPAPPYPPQNDPHAGASACNGEDEKPKVRVIRFKNGGKCDKIHGGKQKLIRS